MLGEVGSLFARGVIFHVWFRGHIGIISVLLFGKKGCERGWGRNAGKGLERVGFVWFSGVLDGFGWFWGPCWPMLGEVGSCGIVWYRGLTGSDWI